MKGECFLNVIIACLVLPPSHKLLIIIISSDRVVYNNERPSLDQLDCPEQLMPLMEKVGSVVVVV